MRIGSTPQHEIEIEYDASLIQGVEVTYSQNDREILTKSTEDCTIEDGVITVKLKESETFLFKPMYDTEVQARIVTTGGQVIPSNVMWIPTEKCLSKKVLTE